MAKLRHRIARSLPAPVRKRLARMVRSLPSFISGYERDRPSSLALDRFDGFEMAFRAGTADEEVLAESFANDRILPSIPEYTPRAGHVVLDVGSHIGAFAVLAASKVPGGVVHAIEASGDTFNLLRINAALNRADNLRPHHVALSDRDGTITLYHDIGNWGHSVVAKQSSQTEEVPCCTLQGFLDRNDIARCDFIKFNCEGAEFPIILSTPVETLRRFGAMVVDYHCDLWKQNTEQDLLDRLHQAGFQTVIKNKGDTRGWIIATRKSGESS